MLDILVMTKSHNSAYVCRTSVNAADIQTTAAASHNTLYAYVAFQETLASDESRVISHPFLYLLQIIEVSLKVFLQLNTQINL